MLLRVLIILVIALMIFLGVRKIWRDWSGQFKRVEDEEKARVRARDLRERQQPGIIELKRDKDGTYRPGSHDDEKS